MIRKFENHLWDALAETSQPIVLSTLSEIIRRDKKHLVEFFYNYMLRDESAAIFLSSATVEARLKPSLEHWLEALFSNKTPEELSAVLAIQRQVGEVHSRADIPVNLVAKGFRLLKRQVNLLVIASSLDQMVMVNAILRVDVIFDIAFEEMTVAYAESQAKGIRNEEAFRHFSAGHNLAAEREKQMVALLEWENKFFRAIATGRPISDLTPLQNASFGLWFRHKAALLFDETRELALVEDGLEQVDNVLFPQLSTFKDQDSTVFRGLIKNILIQTEELKYLINTMFDRLTDMEVGRDPLTQLFNRRFFPTILKREIEISRKKGIAFALLMMDVDCFKSINDAHGHEAGDRVLQQVSALAMNRIRAGDFVFRYGGEEFVIILTEVEANKALDIAEQIRQRIEITEMPLANGCTVNVSVSIGVALSDGHPDYQRLLDRADGALYEAKRGGRNRCMLA